MKLETKVQAPALRRGPERIHLIASLAGKPSRSRSQTALSIDAENFSAEIDFYPSYELVKERLRRVARVGNLWSWTGSNRRHPACKAGALPTELQPLNVSLSLHLPAVIASPVFPGGNLVGLGGLEPPTSRLSGARSSQLSYRPSGFQLRLFQRTEPLRSASQNQTANPRQLQKR